MLGVLKEDQFWTSIDVDMQKVTMMFDLQLYYDGVEQRGVTAPTMITTTTILAMSWIPSTPKITSHATCNRYHTFPNSHSQLVIFISDFLANLPRDPSCMQPIKIKCCSKCEDRLREALRNVPGKMHETTLLSLHISTTVEVELPLECKPWMSCWWERGHLECVQAWTVW